MIFLRTQSGSIYQIDPDQSRIRRIQGIREPTQLQTDNWKTYTSISDIKIGSSVLIKWKDPAEGYIQPATITSPITTISENLSDLQN